MVLKPIFVATHPRSCSTAFERVFISHRDLSSFHEPFADAWYYGPEGFSPRYTQDGSDQLTDGARNSTYDSILNRLSSETEQNKRTFIKDMAYHLQPANDLPPAIAPSLARKKRGVGTTTNTCTEDATKTNEDLQHVNFLGRGNPTVLPPEILDQFQFAVLIRHPQYSVPSYYRCSETPLKEMTGFEYFDPGEAGYKELRRLFDYLRSDYKANVSNGELKENPDGPNGVNESNGAHAGTKICVVDADDLMDNPGPIIEGFCKAVDLAYDPSMLEWDTAHQQKRARKLFAPWKGFHEDVLNSSGLKPREHPKPVLSTEEQDAEWTEKYGVEGAKVIRATVDANIADYEYLKRFALEV